MSNDEERNPNGTMKKGYSANPKGRPPRSRNLITIFNQKRDELVVVKGPDGKPVKMARLDAWITNLWNKAIALDPKASAQIIMLLRASGQLASAPDGADDLDADSGAVLDALIARYATKKPGNGLGQQ